ncbi:MAG: hypothetical protein NUW01_15385, partial [Gemmatimonadaceae bacterium]|nr:hypothetical protein [Gemmatimonadaceae bacterium]
DSVAILVAIRCEGDVYAALVRQFRVPIGREILEIPAGTLEGGEVVGKALEEIQQELELTIKREDLVDLNAATGIGAEHGIPPSPGGCDEHVRFFMVRQSMSRAELNALQGRLTGVLEEGERITVEIAKMENVASLAPDGKTLMALYLYNRLLETDY